jgi:hypothetical protein
LGLRYHLTAYTAQEVAAWEHVPGKHMAKPVIVIVDGQPVMLVMLVSEVAVDVLHQRFTRRSAMDAPVGR